MTFDWALYRGNLAWLAERTIYLCRHGSWAYGTNIASSDEDFRGVAIPPASYYFGSMQRFEQAESKDPDLTVFDLRKFVSLAAQCNPNVIEILFVDPSDRLVVTPLGEELLAHRELFLTRRVRHTFAGYAHSQLKRLRSHRRWVMSPPSHQPTRGEFGLPEQTAIPNDHLQAAEAAIRTQLDSWSANFMDDLPPATRTAVTNKMAEHLAQIGVAMNEDMWPGAARTIGLSDNFIELLAREKRYAAAKREWENYLTWQRERNPARAELEAKHGYDCKHGMHLCRLLRMCREILETGKVLVKRPDAAELLAIRNGAMSYDEIIEWAERQDSELQELSTRSPLPKAPDVEKIDALCVRLGRLALEL